MAAGRNRVLAACGAAVVVLIGIGSSAPVQADPFDGLIVASGPVALAGGDPASGSISVTNPTDQDIVDASLRLVYRNK